MVVSFFPRLELKTLQMTFETFSAWSVEQPDTWTMEQIFSLVCTKIYTKTVEFVA